MIGQNGIIKRAQEAKENMLQASKDEEEALNQLFGELENNSNGENNDNGDSSSGEGMGNATAREILSGYKAYSGGKLLIGTMPNREAVSQTLSAGESYTIPEGYHNGSGVVIAKDLASQTQATATADNITEGKTAYVNGELITGTGVDNNIHYESGKLDGSIKYKTIPKSLTFGTTTINIKDYDASATSILYGGYSLTGGVSGNIITALSISISGTTLVATFTNRNEGNISVPGHYIIIYK